MKRPERNFGSQEPDSERLRDLLTNKRISRRDFLRGAGFATAAAFLAACAPQASPTPTSPAAGPTATGAPSAGTPRRGGTVRWAMTAEAAGPFHPLLATGSTGWFNHWVYESLVDVDAQFANPIARLAERWEASEQARVWTFDLRQGVRWHHGRTFTADDVLFTFEKILDPSFGAAAAVLFADVADLTKVNDYQVRFALRAPNVDFPFTLSAWNARIVPMDLTDEQIESEPRGTGPMRIDNYANADRIAFYRNDDYWMPDVPYLDGAEFVSIPEATTLANALVAGEVDVFHLVSSQIVRSLQGDPNIVLVPTIQGDWNAIYMVLDDPPFDNPNVRRAFKLIADRAAMTRFASPDLPTRVEDDNPVLPTSPFRIDTNVWQQNLAEAARLIREAGYEDGLEVTLWAINDNPGILEFSLAFAEWAREAGVTVTVEGVKADPFYAERWLTVPFGTVGWSARPTVDEQLRIAFHSQAEWNETHYRDPEFDRLLDAARAELDTTKRAEMYAEIQRKLVEDDGHIIPYHFGSASLARRRVQGYVPHPLSGLDPRAVWLAEE